MKLNYVGMSIELMLNELCFKLLEVSLILNSQISFLNPHFNQSCFPNCKTNPKLQQFEQMLHINQMLILCFKIQISSFHRTKNSTDVFKDFRADGGLTADRFTKKSKSNFHTT